MNCFPVLSTGAVCQYPISKTTTFRTIANSLPNGSVLKTTADSPGVIEWELEYEGLSRVEAEALRSFFAEMEGRLGTFLFVDPTSNLLTFSEDLTAGVWVKGPGLAITAGTENVFGPSFLVKNGTAAEQSIGQSVFCPGTLNYCFSVFARSQAGAELSLSWGAGEATERRSFAIGNEWARVFVSGSPGPAQEQIRFTIDFPPGATCEIGGLQVECQLAPSGYKRSVAHNGVYPSARFAADYLEVIATGEDQYSSKFHIIATRQEGECPVS